MNLLSVIIPVKNGGATLAKCLEAIKHQTVADKIEIIILDSMSTDKSRDIVLSYGAKVINIPKETFNHGLTRNIGVQHATGELIYFTVQDAYLSEVDQFERMIYHFEDEEVQSVTGIQGIPSDSDKNPAIWFRRFSKPVPEVIQFHNDEFNNLPPSRQLENCGWDNVNAMYRKAALEKLQFQKTDFAEDALWARDALMRGWKIVRDSSLMVYHYHYETFNYIFRMSFMANYTVWKNFKVLTAIPASIKPFAQNINTILKRSQLSAVQKIKWIFHNGVYHFANILSVIVFRLAYFFGQQKRLDNGYKYFCSVIPQGTQKKSELLA